MARTFFNKTKFPLNETDVIPRFKTKLFGDWEETIRILNRLSPEIKSCSIKAQLRVGRIIRDKVRAHLVNQDLGWTPLNTRYAKTKAKYNLDSRILIAWGEYYHAINTWSVSNQHTVLIGIKSGLYTKTPRGKRSKLELAQIAMIHEFSKKYRRPLWNPTIAELGGVKGIKTLFVTHLYATLGRNGIPFKLIKVF